MDTVVTISLPITHACTYSQMATDSTMAMEQHSAETTLPAPPTSSLSHTPHRIEPLALFGTEAVENLSNGFMAVLEPELVRVHKSLEELV